MRRLSLVAVLSTAAFGQFVAVDGGFHNSVGPDGRLRAVEIFAPTNSGDWFTVSDTGAPRTRLRFRMIGQAPLAQLDGGHLAWGTRRLAPNGDFTLLPPTRLELEPAPGRRFEFDRSADGGTTLNVIGPDRVELHLEGTCAHVAGLQPFSLDCGSFALRAPLLRRYQHVVSVIEFDPLDAVVSTGTAALGRDKHQTLFGWSPTDSWAPPITAPPPFDAERVNAATVWDPVRKQLVVFGGRSADGSRLGDTLIWDGTSWSSPNLATSPPARSDAAFAFDPVRGRAVLFGGLAGDTSLLGDTWEWDGAAWHEQTPVISPSARAQAGLGWDGTRDELLLFSGYGQYDAWTWDGTRWLELTAGFTPKVRPPYAVTWDPSTRLLVIIGSPLASRFSSAAWDGTAWSDVGGFGSVPTLVRSAVSIEGGTYAVASGSSPNRALDAGARTWVDHTMTTLSGPGVPAPDGGIRQLSRGLVRGWAEGPRLWDRWVRTGVLPAEDFLSAATFEGQVFAIGKNDAGVATTWRLGDDGGVEKLASGPRGKLVVQGDALWLLGDGAAWTWDAGWNSTPWSVREVFDAVAARDGGFYVLTRPFREIEGTMVQVDTTGAISTTLGHTTMRPLIPMRGELPFSLHDGTYGLRVGVTAWDEQDGGWVQLAEADSYQLREFASEVLGQDGRGRTFLSSDAPSNDNTTFIFDPWRPNGAYCTRGEQCTNGNCVDARCCDSSCACGACSTASGATEDGVCQQRPVEECSEPTPAEPTPARQCSCGSIGWAALPALFMLRRRRR